MRYSSGARLLKCCCRLLASMICMTDLPSCTQNVTHPSRGGDLGVPNGLDGKDFGVQNDLSGNDAGAPNDLGSGNADSGVQVPPPLDQNDTVVPANYWPLGIDQGVANPADRFRALIVLPVRDPQGLIATVDALYDPSSPRFRNYLTSEQLMLLHAPPKSDIAAVTSWLEQRGMTVDRIARNQLMLEYSGTVGQWNAAFGASLHVIHRSSSSTREPAYAPVTDGSSTIFGPSVAVL